ncbi:MAG: glycosyltransferase family 2 protein [Candidatus Synoicihabitans palmerolidicus]|nr:glycosyltransferase family 2 protein [Candidatus Synoicihabitans palmerolidicus]
MGLARAFSTGLEACLARGADLIVNTDADNQYNAADITLFLAPLSRGEADMVIGARPIASIEHFSPVKKWLKRLGSSVTRWLSRTDVVDAPSGFRAFTRAAAQRLNLFSSYTYTLATIIQAGQNDMAVKSVPIRVNGPQRPSRLVKSMGSYVKRSMVTMLRIFMIYRPVTYFFSVAGVIGDLGLLGGLRFLYFFAIGEGNGHVQSVVFSALLIGSGLLMVVLGLLADLISVNRRLLEKANWRMARMEERLMETHEKSVRVDSYASD